jgi:hydrogenase expression/formation protein HypC
MCLGVPGRLVRWIDRDPLLAVAEIDFGGVTKPCHMACALDAVAGDYVLVHAGIALTIVDERQALRTLELLGGGTTSSGQAENP